MSLVEFKFDKNIYIIDGKRFFFFFKLNFYSSQMGFGLLAQTETTVTKSGQAQIGKNAGKEL